MSTVKLPGVVLEISNILDNGVLRSRVSSIVKTYGVKITGEAAMNAPVDTGALRNSITSESHPQSDLVYIVQDGVEYGARIELGFVGRDKLGRNYNQAAHPFITPAIERNKNDFIRAINQAFK